MKIVFDDDREDIVIGGKKDAEKEVEVRKPKTKKAEARAKRISSAD